MLDRQQIVAELLAAYPKILDRALQIVCRLLIMQHKADRRVGVVNSLAGRTEIIAKIGG